MFLEDELVAVVGLQERVETFFSNKHDISACGGNFFGKLDSFWLRKEEVRHIHESEVNKDLQRNNNGRISYRRLT